MKVEDDKVPAGMLEKFCASKTLFSLTCAVLMLFAMTAGNGYVVLEPESVANPALLVSMVGVVLRIGAITI